MKISLGNMTVELNIFHIRKQPLDYDQMNQVCLIEEILDEIIEESSIDDVDRNSSHSIYFIF
jgi:hypothetical protein